MISIIDKHNCCGCEACVQACPKHCISFNEDAEGFHYPKVDEKQCVECGACEKACPILNHIKVIAPNSSSQLSIQMIPYVSRAHLEVSLRCWQKELFVKAVLSLVFVSI